MSPYDLPAWASLTASGATCDCDLMPVAASYPVGLGRRSYTTVEVCWACLLMERAMRDELPYRVACELADRALSEYVPAVQAPPIDNILKKLLKLAARRRGITVQEAAEKVQRSTRDARYALLMAEASGQLSLKRTKEGAVYRA
jgi:hypothetical protein